MGWGCRSFIWLNLNRHSKATNGVCTLTVHEGAGHGCDFLPSFSSWADVCTSTDKKQQLLSGQLSKWEGMTSDM